MPVIQHKPAEEADARLGENPASNPRATIGGNEPPLEDRIAMEFRDALLDERPDFLTRMDDAIAAVGRAEVTDDETLGRAGDLDRILRACAQRIDDTHKAVKQPYLDGSRACDAEKRRLTGPVDDARFKLRDMMNAFMAEREAARRAEEARIRAAQVAAAEAAAAAERARQEAAGENDPEAVAAVEAVALAPTAAKRPEPVRSDAGATVSGRQVWHSQVEDYAKAFKHVRSDPKVREAVDAAVQRLVKAGQRELTGVKVWSTTQAVAR